MPISVDEDDLKIEYSLNCVQISKHGIDLTFEKDPMAMIINELSAEINLGREE